MFLLSTRIVVGPGNAASLWFSSGSSWEESDAEKGTFHMLQADRREHVVIIASERLTGVEEDWVEVPNNHIMVVKSNMNILIIPVEEAVKEATAAGPAKAMAQAAAVATPPALVV